MMAYTTRIHRKVELPSGRLCTIEVIADGPMFHEPGASTELDLVACTPDDCQVEASEWFEDNLDTLYDQLADDNDGFGPRRGRDELRD